MNNYINLLNSFLIVYFYNIEQILNQTDNELQNIKFQSEEANTDEYLKKYFQEFLCTHNNISDIKLKKLIIKIDEKENIIDIKKLSSYKIKNVLLPENLTFEQKKKITNSKKSVYTNPDLYLEITNGESIFFESIELKSTKDNIIPGSSIQQISPFEWVIFIKRDKEKVIVTTGFYINSITEKLPFPDRSPRPQIGFKTLLNWNKKYIQINDETLIISTITESNNDKIKLLTDWQNYLTSEWLEIILTSEIKNNEKWFNNTIRKFALILLEYNENLTEEKKEILKNNLKNLIN